MNSDTLIWTDIISGYNTVALLIGQTILGVLIMGVLGAGSWLVFMRGRRLAYDIREVIKAKRAGWTREEGGYEWHSPDGATRISEIAGPNQWTIYRGRSYSRGDYPLWAALRWAMTPADKVPWIRMVEP